MARCGQGESSLAKGHRQPRPRTAGEINGHQDSITPPRKATATSSVSLVKALDDGSLLKHPRRELILHLIATHHGHGRPGFQDQAYASCRCGKLRRKRPGRQRFALPDCNASSAGGSSPTWKPWSSAPTLLPLPRPRSTPPRPHEPDRNPLQPPPTRSITSPAADSSICWRASMAKRSAIGALSLPVAFVLESGLSEEEFLALLLPTLTDAPKWRFVRHNEGEEPVRIDVSFAVPGRAEPLIVSLDWWYETADLDGSIDQKSAWKMYAGQQTVERITTDMIAAVAGMEAPQQLSTMLEASIAMTGRFGIRSACLAQRPGRWIFVQRPWPAGTNLRFRRAPGGFSASTPFFPARTGQPEKFSSARGWRDANRSEDDESGSSFIYRLWTAQEPLALARLAAQGNSSSHSPTLLAPRAMRKNYSNLTLGSTHPTSRMKIDQYDSLLQNNDWLARRDLPVALTLTEILEPVGGPEAVIFPPTYARRGGDNPYAISNFDSNLSPQEAAKTGRIANNCDIDSVGFSRQPDGGFLYSMGPWVTWCPKSSSRPALKCESAEHRP